MAKRSTAASPPATATLPPWHPIEDGIEPIIETLASFIDADFQALAKLPEQLQYQMTTPGSVLVEQMADRPETLRQWLQVHALDGIAAEIHGRLQVFLAQLREWEFRARQDKPDRAGTIFSEGVRDEYNQVLDCGCQLIDYMRQIGDMIRWRLSASSPKVPIHVDLAGAAITVDGERFDDGIKSHWCRWVQAMVDAQPDYVSGSKLNELPGCGGKNVSREMSQLKEAVPSLALYLESESKLGYRLRSK